MMLPLGVFLAVWTAMMAAMMAPSVTPLAVRYARIIESRRVVGLASFVGGYLCVWSASRLLAYHTRLGQEIVAEEFRVNDGPLQWEYSGRCGFVNDFAYASGA